MAKDPAFLFYPGDWLGGTMTFSRAHKGAYMDLLMCQFNQGHMAIQDIKDILGEKDFNEMWDSKLKSKFNIDLEGRFYNEKLETEIVKRKNYTDSRKKNLKSTSKQSDHMSTDMAHPYETHMIEHMENENENINVFRVEDKKEGVGERKGEGRWFDENLPLPTNTLEAAEMNQFTHTQKKNTEFILEQWRIFLLERLGDPPEMHFQHRKTSDLTRYFLNWVRPKFPKPKPNADGAHRQSSSGSGGQKLGTSAAQAAAIRAARAKFHGRNQNAPD